MTVVDLLATDDPEAAAFFADARAALNRQPAPTAKRARKQKPKKHTNPVQAAAQPLAVVTPVIDLSDLPDAPVYPTGEDLRPLLTGDSVRNLKAAFRLHDEGRARQAAYDHAVRADDLQKAGAPVVYVFKALARAEQAAPADTRPWHAERLDAYTTAYGLRGWYRYTDFRDTHCIAINKLRFAAEGDRGRYFATRDFAPVPPLTYSVVDRDTGRTVYRAVSDRIARQWIDEREAM